MNKWNHATGKIEAKQSRTLRAPASFNRFPGRNDSRSADTLPGSVRQAPEAAVGLDRTPGYTLGSMIICLVPKLRLSQGALCPTRRIYVSPLFSELDASSLPQFSQLAVRCAGRYRSSRVSTNVVSATGH